MSSKDFGLGPKWWQKPGNKLQKCAERKSNWCDPEETDGCCAVIACTYCLELEAYGGRIQYGTSDFATEGWEGEVGGNSFFGFWEKNYDGICEFVVVFNGAEVYRESCDGGQSCRDSSDETEVVIDYKDYTLRWIKHEPLPLQYVKEEGTNCTVHFCDDCECSCECLCVTVDNEGKITKGEICNVSSYPCDGPVWQGIIDYFDISLALGRDEYGRCVIAPTVDGIELEPVLAPGCAGMSARIELSYTVSIEVSCKKCDCPEESLVLCCAGTREAPSQLFAEMGQCFVGRLAGTDCEVSDWSAGAEGSGVLTSFERSGEGRLASYHGQLTITEQVLSESDGVCTLVDVTRTINLCIECALGTDQDSIDIRWSNATEDSGNLCVGSPFPHDGISITIENCPDLPVLPDCPTFTDSDVHSPVWAVTPAWTYSGGGVYVIACCDPFLIYVFVEKDSVPDWPSGGGWLLITE